MHLCICVFVYLPVNLFICQSVMFVELSFRQCICVFIWLPVSLSVHLSICQFLLQSACLLVGILIYLSICSSVHLLDCHSFHFSICLSVHTFIALPSCQSFFLSAIPCMLLRIRLFSLPPTFWFKLKLFFLGASISQVLSLLTFFAITWHVDKRRIPKCVSEGKREWQRKMRNRRVSETERDR